MSTTTFRQVLEERLEPHHDAFYAACDSLTVEAWGMEDGESPRDRWIMQVQDRVIEAVKEAADTTIEAALRSMPQNVLSASSGQLRQDAEAVRPVGLRAAIEARSVEAVPLN